MTGSAEYRTDRLMQHLGVSALFIAMMYIIVVFLVWRGVQRVFRETPNWNTLKIFSLALLIVPSLRAASFVCHFLIYGGFLGKDSAKFLKDLIMNSLYLIPTFIFLFTYMVLICIWIEITMFSRDQYLIQHSKYTKIWKYVWFTVISLIICALIFIFVYASYTGNLDFITALYTSLWVMTFVVPLFAFIIWVILIIRFAGFPYLNYVWKQQTVRMFYVVSVWTIGQLISGVMTAIWSHTKGDWVNKDDYIWFSLSVALCLLFSEIFPLMYTSDWHRMGFLLMAFVNWRDLWIRNQRHALAHDPRLIDDLFQSTRSKPTNSSALEFKPFNTNSKRYNSLGYNLLASEYDTESPYDSLSPKGGSAEPIHNSALKIFKNKKHRIDFDTIIIDTNLIIPTYVYPNCDAFYSTHRARFSKRKNTVELQDNELDNMEFCLKIFECNEIDKAMLDPIYENLLKFKKLEHEGLGIVYDVNFKSKKIEILSAWYSGGSLFDIIDMSPTDTPFAQYVIKRMILQIALFMDWLHRECKIPHGHLKSRNILFDAEFNVCVTDIGLISLKKTMNILLPSSNFDGYWMDKEYFLGKSIKSQCDVWAFGFILYEIITKKQPFPDANIDYIKKCIVNNNNMPQVPEHCASFLKELMTQCWNVERAKRPTFLQIVDMIRTEMS